MHQDNLWTAADDDHVAAFTVAVDDGRLADALLSVDCADMDVTARCREQLDDWADLLRRRVDPEDPARCAAGLRRLLVRQLSFRGDTDDYYCPDNASFSQVMQRRRGMPIVLCTVWIEVGHRAGVPMHGIGMPGHFIARVGGVDGLLVDPFSGGCRITVKQCAHLVDKLSNAALPWSDEYLQPVACDAIVERVLRNLANAHKRQEDLPALFRISRFHASLRPEQPEPLLMHACVADQLGAFQLAARLYDQVCQRFPEARERRVAARRRDQAVRRASRLH